MKYTADYQYAGRSDSNYPERGSWRYMTMLSAEFDGKAPTCYAMSMNDKHVHYFAYGSNMHPFRMRNRVPSALNIDIAYLENHSLCFHKRGWSDGSGKCNAFFAGSSDDSVIGVVYRLHESERHLLDRYEGVGNGYEIANVRVFSESREYAAFTYMAAESHIDEAISPYSWYKQYVVHGALYHKLPDPYIARIREVEAISDPDQDRAEKEFAVVRSFSESVLPG